MTPSLRQLQDALLAAGVPCEAHENGLTATFLGTSSGLPENAALALDLELNGDRTSLSADFGVDARAPETLIDLLWLANDLNATLRVGRAFVEPELNGDQLAGATLWVRASLRMSGETCQDTLPGFFQDFGEDVQAVLHALTCDEA